ncbi:hypothetical protein D3C87_1819880 [compost metagenome]
MRQNGIQSFRQIMRLKERGIHRGCTEGADVIHTDRPDPLRQRQRLLAALQCVLASVADNHEAGNIHAFLQQFQNNRILLHQL